MTKPNQLAFFAAAAITWLSVSSAWAATPSEFQVSNRTPRQGDTIEVVLPASANSAGGPEDFVSFNGHRYKYFPVPATVKTTVKGIDNAVDGVTGGASDSEPNAERSSETGSQRGAIEYKALLAVPADLDPGKYLLKSGDQSVTLTVRAGVFPLQHIHLAPSKDNFDTAPGEEESVEKAKSTISDTRHWSGPFTAPSKARTSTGFGLKRMVNGRLLKDYFHSGLDYAGALGSPIMACSGGKVVLVGRGFKLHGNTVAIDHGQGVVSFYIHMKTIKVAEGELVKGGQPIGTVGQTGRATGPHLHFSIYVNKVAANPSNWFATTF